MAKSRSESLLIPFLGERDRGSYGTGSRIRPGEESTMPGPGRDINVVAQLIGRLRIEIERAA